MKREIYLKHRQVFEENYNRLKPDNSLEFVNLYDLKYGIYNYALFLNIYYFDKRPHLSNIVTSIDGRKRFMINGKPALKIKLITSNSMVDNWRGEFEKILAFVAL